MKNLLFKKNEIWLAATILMAFVASGVFYFQAERKIDRAGVERYQFYLLADELRHSSDELTRMARTYLATGDVRYKQFYQEIIDIRNGKIPRPKQYTPLYWAFKATRSSEAMQDTAPAISLRALIKNAEFTDRELSKLFEAENQSNELAKLELNAMNLYDRNQKNNEGNRRKLESLLYDENYFNAKLKVMKPIAELYSLVDERTNAAFVHAQHTAFLMLTIPVLLLFFMVITLWRAYAKTIRILGGAAGEIHAQLDRIASGNLNVPIKCNFPNSVLAHLAIMQNNLRQSLLEKQKIDDDLRVSAIAFESQEGIFITDCDNRIVRANQAVTRITGYSTAEIIGKNPSLLKSDRHDNLFYAAMWDSLKNMGTWSGEIWDSRKNGEIFPAQFCITVVKNAHGILTNYVATFTDITASKLALNEIERLAFYDPLTQLPNRRLFLDRLSQGMITCARNNQLGALLFIDLDHFKNLNDTLGHNVGDLLLQKVAERMASSVRKIDTVARIGGDEFVVILLNLNKTTKEAIIEVEAIISQINTALKQPYQLINHTYNVTCSIGVVLIDKSQMSVDELIKRADIAMYHAKSAGRNTFKFFDEWMQKDFNVSVHAEQELHDAILDKNKKQFELYYQAQVNQDRQLIGVEALIRWMHPNQDPILPSSFINLAEKLQLIAPLTKWVLEQACAQLKLWEQNELTRSLTMSINISAEYFYCIDFIHDVRNTITLYLINPNLLQFELTESMLIRNVEDTIAKMHLLRKMGINISLDDFGTGYSSLQYLTQLPIQQLKIDQSFVRNIFDGDTNKTVIKTIIVMAQNMKLNILAEGVETDDQYKFLLAEGCLHHQGFLFGRPVPIDDFEKLHGISIPRIQKI